MTSRSSRAVWRLSTLILAAGLFAVRFGCSYDPHFQSGVTRCAPTSVSKRCPDGYACDEASGFCITGGGDGGAGAGTGGNGGAIVGVEVGTGGNAGAGSGGLSGGGAGGIAGSAAGGVAGTGGTSATGGKGGAGVAGMGAGGTPGTGGMTAGVGGSGGAVTGTIVTFRVLTPNSHPFQITRGPDDNLWFVEDSASKIGRCTPSGTVTEFPTPTPSAALDDIVSQGGFLWVAETNLSKIAKCDTNGNVLAEYPIMIGTSSTTIWLAAGPDGNIWYTDSSNDRVGRMTPAGVSMAFAAASGSSPLRIITGPDGNLWFTEFAGSRISKITTGGLITRYTIPTSSAFPVAIASDGTTGLAFLEISKVGRITATSGQFTAEYPLPTGVLNSDGGNVVLGPDGNFWFTNGAESILRMTPTGTMTRYIVPGNNPGASGLVLGPDGNLWFVDVTQSLIGRITP